LEEQAVSMPNFPQVTRIRMSMLMYMKYLMVIIGLEIVLN
jgi:hypothetical protein